eukprot:scpid75204/ scgid0235/ 
MLIGNPQYLLPTRQYSDYRHDQGAGLDGWRVQEEERKLEEKRLARQDQNTRSHAAGRLQTQQSMPAIPGGRCDQDDHCHGDVHTAAERTSENREVPSTQGQRQSDTSTSKSNDALQTCGQSGYRSPIHLDEKDNVDNNAAAGGTSPLAKRHEHLEQADDKKTDCRAPVSWNPVSKVTEKAQVSYSQTASSGTAPPVASKVDVSPGTASEGTDTPEAAEEYKGIILLTCDVTQHSDNQFTRFRYQLNTSDFPMNFDLDILPKEDFTTDPSDTFISSLQKESQQTDALILTSTGREEADNIKAALVEAMVSSKLSPNQHVQVFKLPQQWDTGLLEEDSSHWETVLKDISGTVVVNIDLLRNKDINILQLKAGLHYCGFTISYFELIKNTVPTPATRSGRRCSLGALSIAPLYARVNLQRDDADYTAVSDQMMIALRFGSDGKKVDVRVIPNEEWPQRTTRDVQSALVSENSLSIQAENTESTAGGQPLQGSSVTSSSSQHCNEQRDTSYG